MAGLVDTLEDSGYTVWWDPGLIAGSNFAREIQSQIGQAGAVIVIWTPKATESDWVLAEVQRALAREKLLCVRCSDLPLDRVPLPYNALHTIDLTDPVRLLAALRRRAIHPSKPERVWDFYGEPIETRRRAMERFQRITAAYLDQIGSRQVNALDPALDVQIMSRVIHTIAMSDCLTSCCEYTPHCNILGCGNTKSPSPSLLTRTSAIMTCLTISYAASPIATV